MYRPATALMLNNLLGSGSGTCSGSSGSSRLLSGHRCWSRVWSSFPGIDTWERRRPYAFAVGVLAVTLTLRYALVGVVAGPTERYALPVVLWCIALAGSLHGRRPRQARWSTSVLAAGATYGFFDDLVREGLVVGGLLLLTWLPRVAAPHRCASWARSWPPRRCSSTSPTGRSTRTWRRTTRWRPPCCRSQRVWRRGGATAPWTRVFAGGLSEHRGRGVCRRR